MLDSAPPKPTGTLPSLVMVQKQAPGKQGALKYSRIKEYCKIPSLLTFENLCTAASEVYTAAVVFYHKKVQCHRHLSYVSMHRADDVICILPKVTAVVWQKQFKCLSFKGTEVTLLYNYALVDV